MDKNKEIGLIREFNEFFKKIVSYITMGREDKFNQTSFPLDDLIREMRERYYTIADPDIKERFKNLIYVGELFKTITEDSLDLDYENKPINNFFRRFNELYYDNEDRLFKEDLSEEEENTILQKIKTDPLIADIVKSKESFSSLQVLHYLILEDQFVGQLSRLAKKAQTVDELGPQENRYLLKKVEDQIGSNNDLLSLLRDEESLLIDKQKTSGEFYQNLETLITATLKQKSVADAQKILSDLGMDNFGSIFDKTLASNIHTVFPTDSNTMSLDFMRCSPFIDGVIGVDGKIGGNSDWLWSLKLANSYANNDNTKLKGLFCFLSLGKNFDGFTSSAYEQLWNLFRTTANTIILKKYIVLRKLVPDQILLFEESTFIEDIFVENSFKILKFVCENFYSVAEIPSKGKFLDRLRESVKGMKGVDKSIYDLIYLLYFSSGKGKLVINRQPNNLNNTKSQLDFEYLNYINGPNASKDNINRTFRLFLDIVMGEIVTDCKVNPSILFDSVENLLGKGLDIDELIYLFPFIEDKDVLVKKLSEYLSVKTEVDEIRRTNQILNSLFDKEIVNAVSELITKQKRRKSGNRSRDIDKELEDFNWVTTNPDQINLALETGFDRFIEKLVKCEYDSAIEFYSKYLEAVLLRKSISYKNKGDLIEEDYFSVDFKEKTAAFKRLHKALSAVVYFNDINNSDVVCDFQKLKEKFLDLKNCLVGEFGHIMEIYTILPSRFLGKTAALVKNNVFQIVLRSMGIYFGLDVERKEDDEFNGKVLLKMIEETNRIDFEKEGINRNNRQVLRQKLADFCLRNVWLTEALDRDKSVE